jgi:antitoxin PrlF
MISDATVTTKGRITIPKEIRDGLGLQPGDQITFTLVSDSAVTIRAKTKRFPEPAALTRNMSRKAIGRSRLLR